MNTHLDELINRWREGQLSDEELRRLTDALATQEGRAALRGDWFLEAALPEALRTSPVLKLAQKMDPMATPQRRESNRWTGWLSWRPLTAAAAGLLIGLFGASAVFGFGNMGNFPQVKRIFPLKNGNFEQGVGTLPANPPADFGLWTGVRSEVVDQTSETGPKSGKRMLRFMRGDANASKPDAPADRCDVYQLIDLRPIWQQVGPEDEVTLALSASFLDAQAASDEKTAFRCRILVNPGSPDLVRAGWPDSRMGGCAYARADLETSPATRGQWQTAQAKVFLPRNAQVVAVQLSVSLAAESSGSDDVFRQCYADDVTLTVSSHAPSPKK